MDAADGDQGSASQNQDESKPYRPLGVVLLAQYELAIAAIHALENVAPAQYVDDDASDAQTYEAQLHGDAFFVLCRSPLEEEH